MVRTKRANGEGSVYQVTTPDGSHWRAALTVEGRRKERRAKTRREALQKLAELKALRDRRTLDGGITLGDWLTRWLTETVAPELSPRTLDIYRYGVGRVPAWLARRPLSEVTPLEIQAWQRELVTRYAPETVNSSLRAVGTAYQEALRMGVTDRNPVQPVRGVPVRRRARPVIDATEGAAILRAMEGTRYHAMTALMLLLGLRYGEASGLTWDAVDFTRRRVEVRQQAQYTRPQDRPAGAPRWTLRPPKTTRSRRILPLPAAVADALVAHRAAYGAGPLITMPTRGAAAVDEGVYNRALAARLAAAGLTRRTPHELRHGCASLLLALGVPPRTIADILGHTSLDLTLFRYAHVGEGLLDGAAAAIDTAFSPVAGFTAGGSVDLASDSA